MIVCPQCGSDDITIWHGMHGYMMNLCKNCGHRGTIFPEMTKPAVASFKKRNTKK